MGYKSIEWNRKWKKNRTTYLDSDFWDNVAFVVKMYEPLYHVLRLVETEVVPTMPILYELMRVMKDAVKQQRGNTKWIINIIQNRWDKMLNHPLHAAETILGYSDLLKAAHIVYLQLDPEAAGIANFRNELKLRDMAAEKDKVDGTDFIDLLQVAAEAGDDNENPFFGWVRPAYLDDDEGNPDP
ncbi:hypothetical protein Ddye_025941 [Dipteronia dyeriana]|uniref:Uncharacterized protein n=1 Tax=Dipteronia dyeriana TaxID=168575 RepID=A0AAD9WP02_9ROSI|nr:hypothetical protein Ddye_025941 [Dipteronia dyeriana]